MFDAEKKNHFDSSETSMNSNVYICFGVNSRVTKALPAEEDIDSNDFVCK